MRKNKDLKAELVKGEKRVREGDMDEMKGGKIKKNDKANLDFKEIIEKHLKNKNEDVEKEVVKALKNNEDLVRDAAGKKKNVIVYGIKEKNITCKLKRDKEETKTEKDLLKKLNDEDDIKFKEEVDEVVLLGLYLQVKTRHMKIRLKLQQAAEEILERTSKLTEV